MPIPFTRKKPIEAQTVPKPTMEQALRGTPNLPEASIEGFYAQSQLAGQARLAHQEREVERAAAVKAQRAVEDEAWEQIEARRGVAAAIQRQRARGGRA